MLLPCALIVALFAGPQAAPIGDPMAPYRGQPVLTVDVKAPPGNDPNELRNLIDIQPGYLLNPSDVQDAVRRLYALGRFSQVSVTAERLTGVVLLHFRVDPLRRLAGVNIVGNDNVSTKSLQRAVGLGTNEEVDSRTEALLTERLLKFLHRAGYREATVHVERRPEVDPGMVPFTITVHEGPPVRVRTMRIEGPMRVPAPLLLVWCDTQEGAVFNQDELAHDRDHIKQRLIERGFLRAFVSEPVVHEDGLDADVFINVTAGDRIDVEFSGNTVFSDQSLRALWPEQGGGMGRNTLRLFETRIVNAYQRQGHPRAKVDIHGFREADRGITRYVYQITEGVPTEVGEIYFPGARAFPAEVLAEQVRATLRKDLPGETFFQPMNTKSKRASLLADEPLGPPPRIDAENRWVPDLFQQAADQIAAAYRDVGYLSVEVDTPKPKTPAGVSPPPCLATHAPGLDRCSFDVDIVVHEGEQSFLHSLGFTGNQAFPARELLEVVRAVTANRPLSAPLTPGGPFSVSGIEDGRIELVRHYRDQGFLYVRVFSNVQLSANGLWADVRYTIEEGPQVRVQRILVRGNRFTREGVIRSRISFHNNDLYRLEQAVGDQRSIASLGVFSNVRVKLIDEEHPSERKDLVADVIERNRQPIEIIPGISTADGPRVRTSYSYLNLLGTATGFTASLKLNRQIFFDLFDEYADTLRQRYDGWQGSEQLTKALERQVRLGLRSPPIKQFPFDPVFRLDLVDQRVNDVNYSLDNAAAIFGIDAYLHRRIKISFDNQFSFTDLECPLENNCDQDPDLRNLTRGAPIEVGQRYTYKVGPYVTFDWRDNPLSPSRGMFASVRVAEAIGKARGDSSQAYVPFAFLKYEGNITAYAPIWKAVLAMSLRGGNIDIQRSGVPLDERFFLGGRDTIRGFVEGTLIAQDVCVVADPNAPVPRGCNGAISDSVLDDGTSGPPISQGGDTYLLLKTELRIPLREQVSLDLFCDLGNLWVDFDPRRAFAVRVGTGFGLRYATPVGALAVDLGINPMPRAANQEPYTQIHFSIGSF